MKRLEKEIAQQEASLLPFKSVRSNVPDDRQREWELGRIGENQ